MEPRMHTFEVTRWQNKAWNRLQSKVRAEAPDTEDAGWRYAQDMLAIEGLSRVVKWCRRKKIEVVFYKRAAATYIPQHKRIEISSTVPPIKQLCYLLHECGHLLIGTSEGGRYALGYPMTDTPIERTFAHKATCLEEEFDAWHRGWKLSQRLRVNLSREFFDKIRFTCLKTYIKWAGGVK